MINTGAPRRRRLIEVAFPLEEVSEHSRREKNVRHGHISTLHIWWARRPLAACRAFIYASLVDDPNTDAEREALLREVADLASWDAVRHPERVVRTTEAGGSGLTGTQLLERARQRILDCNDGKPPKLLDPFAGGGAIPLEGLRLGCEVEASDLNPVAVLILKGTVEYPQKYGQPNSRPVPEYIREAGLQSAQSRFVDSDPEEAYRRNPLATDVRYWGNWMLEKAREELAQFYPPDPDGSIPVAYLWSRTIPCPSCNAEMPLIRQYWLARRAKKRIALKPVIGRDHGRIDFQVVEGPNVTGNPAEATTNRGDTKCLNCGQVVKSDRVKEAGIAGQMAAVLTAVVTSGEGTGKRYRPDEVWDVSAFQRASEALNLASHAHIADLPLIPDEPLAEDPRGIWCYLYGLTTFGKLFNARQLLTLTTFARLVGGAHADMLRAGLDDEYAKAVTTYLGLAVDRLADYNATVSRWGNDDEGITNTFARQSLPMVWDYGEANPIGASGGSWQSLMSGFVRGLESAKVGQWKGITLREDAGVTRDSTRAVLTDPPYYDSINYADLSDFFYVWLKRSIGFLHPDLLALPLTPKREQIVMNVYATSHVKANDRKEAAREHYVGRMSEAFTAMGTSLETDGLLGVVFAHTHPDAWSTLIEGLLGAGLVPNASWPIDTEQQNKVSGIGQARLSTSVWMACLKREDDTGDAFLGDVMEEMRPVVRDRLLYFWSKGIRGADFFISAIGPALSVFGRYERVLRPRWQCSGSWRRERILRHSATRIHHGGLATGATWGGVGDN